MRRHFILTLLVIICASSSMAQNPNANGLALLRQAYKAHVPNSAPHDILITADRVVGNGRPELLKLYVQGSKTMRFETGQGADQVVSVFGGDDPGWTSRGNKTQVIPPHVLPQRLTLLPFLDLLTEDNNPSLQIATRESVMLGGRPAYHIVALLPDPTQGTKTVGRRFDEIVDFYIDQQTSLVLRSDHQQTTAENMDLRVPAILEFSDYRMVGGIAIPFRIVETIGMRSTGIRQATITIRSAEVNGGVSPSLFRKGGGQ